MMGGGFGGCVLNLVSDGACESFLDEVDRRYAARYGLHPRTIDVVIGGAPAGWSRKNCIVAKKYLYL